MANATVVYANTQRPIESVTLVLNHQEAVVLRTILDHIGGPTDGPRGISDDIARALYSVGVLVWKSAIIGGNIYFKGLERP